MKSVHKFMIVSGEASGDRHAAKLVSALREIEPSCEFFGAAGPRMRDAGVDAVVRSDELSVVGLLEIGRALPMFLSAYRRLKESAVRNTPDVVVLVDFPDFNLKLARWLKKKGFPIVYYISPQLWAWRKYRISTMRKNVDLLIAILPFEKQWYAEHGVEHVKYVGSPLAREVHPTLDAEQFCQKHKIDRHRPIISLLPGSRQKEIIRILPVMLETAEKMIAKDPKLLFLIAAADERSRKLIEHSAELFFSQNLKIREHVLIVENETYDSLNVSDAAAVASGTATLETGMIGTPLVVVYKTSEINYKLLEPLIDVDHYGLINLIAEERLATELIQDEFTPQTLAVELFRLLDPEVNSAMRHKLRQASEKLGHGGASKRAAKTIMELLEKNGRS